MTRVIIHVRGGVAQVSHTTAPIEVLLCDWDNIESEGASANDFPSWQKIKPSTPEEFDKELDAIEDQVQEERGEE